MLPVLFLNISTYYVLWGAALVMMCLWTRRRASFIYGIPRDDASEILWWSLLGAFVGATAGGYIDHWDRFAQSPLSLLRFWESGLSSGPGFIAGGMFGLWRSKRLGVSVGNFAEAASVPSAFMLAVGRLGCFANGCCVGLPTASPLGVRFPSAQNVAVWPTQLFESAAALVIGVALIAVERGRVRRHSHLGGAVIFPIFLILYGAYRVAFDFLRAGPRHFGIQTGQFSAIISITVGICWLIRSISAKPSDKSS
jgi:phosphatidylglycerol:prolipoprotein diacylglycerol transferase